MPYGTTGTTELDLLVPTRLPQTSSSSSSAHTDTFSTLYNQLERLIEGIDFQSAKLQKRDSRERRIAKIAFVTATVQALIYVYPGFLAMTKSKQVDKVFPPSWARDIVTGYAVTSGFTSNWLLGASCTMAQLEKTFLRGLVTPEMEFLTTTTLSPREGRLKKFLEIAAFGFAFTSTWPFAALAMDDVIVAWAPAPVRALYATGSALICLTPVHLQGLAEWVGMIINFIAWLSSNAAPYDYALLQMRKSLVAALEQSEQAYLHQKVDDGIATIGQLNATFRAGQTTGNKQDALVDYILGILKLGKNVGQFDARLNGKLSKPYKRLQNEYEVHGTVRTSLEKLFELNERGSLESVRDYYHVTSPLDKLRDTAYATWFTVFNTAVTGSLLGYAETARTGIIGWAMDGTNCQGEDSSCVPDWETPTDAANALGWTVFGLVLTPLVGLCIKSSPQTAAGLWDTFIGLIHCDDPAERKKILAEVIMPKTALFASILAVLACAGSGGTNAKVNEDFLSPTELMGFMKITATALWGASWVSSPVVNWFYGRLVTAAWGLSWGMKKLDPNSKSYADGHSQITELTQVMNEVSTTVLKEIVDGLNAKEPDTLKKVAALNGMREDSADLVISRTPQISPASTSCFSGYRFFRSDGADTDSDDDYVDASMPLFMPQEEAKPWYKCW